MPGGDRTGPLGQGPMTGRGMGYCAGNPAPGFATGFGGRGYWGGARGGGRGWRNRFYATGLTGWQRAGMGWGGPWAGAQPVPFTQQNQLEGLKAQAGQLEEALQEIRRQMESIKESAKE